MVSAQTFLRWQISRLVVQHAALLASVRRQADEADGQGYRAMCARYCSMLEKHQAEIQAYGDSVGMRVHPIDRHAFGGVIEQLRSLADAHRPSDFEHLVTDIAMIRRAQDTFGIFGRAGARLGERRLAELGRRCEKDYDIMQREFNEYLASEFIAQVRRESGLRFIDDDRAAAPRPTDDRP